MDPLTISAAVLTVLTPYLAKIGEVTAEKIGASIPEHAGKLLDSIKQKFAGKPAAAETMQDLIKTPFDEDTQAAFRKELKKVFSEDSEFINLLAELLEKAQREAAQSNSINTKISGDQNIAVNVGGDVQGNIVIGSNNKISKK